VIRMCLVTEDPCTANCDDAVRCPWATNQWQSIILDSGRHVTPLGDLRQHVEYNCWCKPDDDDGTTVHHAMDRREEFETGRLKS
jgi:hypothetical protein